MSLGMSLLRGYIFGKKYTFRTEFSSYAGLKSSLLKIFLAAWTALEVIKLTLSVTAADGAEGLGFLCCTRASSSNHPDCCVNIVHYVSTRCLEF